MDVVRRRNEDKIEAFLELGLNPCFNGCSTPTFDCKSSCIFQGSLNPCFNGCSTPTEYNSPMDIYISIVSILVLMDVVRRQSEVSK